MKRKRKTKENATLAALFYIEFMRIGFYCQSFVPYDLPFFPWRSRLFFLYASAA